MCETYRWADKTYKELVPCGSNMRYWAQKIFETVKAEKPWFGIEQEYTLLEKKGTFDIRPAGWPDQGQPGN